MRSRGFKCAKLRVKGRTLKEDVDNIAAIRRGIGDDMVLGVDANQGWLVTILDRVPAWDLKRAVAFAAACADHGIEWLEEPLDSRDYDGNAALKRAS